MYYQNYEDYMRQVLGYPNISPNIYELYNYRAESPYEDTYNYRNQTTGDFITNMSDEEIKDCYPEIYNQVYPIVCKVCEANTMPITKELIEKMTDEVYGVVEGNSTIVNVRVDTPKTDENRSFNIESSSDNIKTPTINSLVDSKRTERQDRSSKTILSENRKVPIEKETRQRNSNLRDLIRILLLFRLFGNRPHTRPRPPRPPFPGRPPISGGPGQGTGRPPIGPGGPGMGRPPIMQPRDYTDYLEF